jgi:hypothetical protein
MQTFLPYPGFAPSAAVLDLRRLGKQRVETFQILRALTWPSYAWKNHPAVRMWRGFVPALVAYGLAVCDEWCRRGGSDTVRTSLLEFVAGQPPDPIRLRSTGQLPGWLGWPELHLSHRSALVRKDPDHYRMFFPDVPDDLPYVWPPDFFPRWPVRRGGDPAAMLGFPSLRPGQAEAVAALQAGSDVLLCMPPGAGATSTGLIAGLTLPRPTLWLTDRAGDVPARNPAAPGRALDGVVDAPADGSSGKPSVAGQTARSPGPEEHAAMAAEIDAAQRPDFVFHPPARLSEREVRRQIVPRPPGLIVVDDVDLHDPLTLPRWPRQWPAPRPPILVLSGGGPPEVRDAALRRLDLRGAAVVGAGWDRPGMTLAAYEVGSEIARRRRLSDLVRTWSGPVLVVAPQGGARTIAAALIRSGWPSAVLSPSLRPATVTDRLAAARRGRLAALVLDGEMTPTVRALIPPTLRIRAVALVGLPRTSAELHAALLPGADAVAVLTRSADSTTEDSELASWARHGRCRWADLLDRFGETVSVPCGRCDLCGMSPPGGESRQRLG